MPPIYDSFSNTFLIYPALTVPDLFNDGRPLYRPGDGNVLEIISQLADNDKKLAEYTCYQDVIRNNPGGDFPGYHNSNPDLRRKELEDMARILYRPGRELENRESSLVTGEELEIRINDAFNNYDVRQDPTGLPHILSDAEVFKDLFDIGRITAEKGGPPIDTLVFLGTGSLEDKYDENAWLYSYRQLVIMCKITQKVLDEKSIPGSAGALTQPHLHICVDDPSFTKKDKYLIQKILANIRPTASDEDRVPVQLQVEVHSNGESLPYCNSNKAWVTILSPQQPYREIVADMLYAKTPSNFPGLVLCRKPDYSFLGDASNNRVGQWWLEKREPGSHGRKIYKDPIGLSGTRQGPFEALQFYVQA
jgi:hypothetical protein